MTPEQWTARLNKLAREMDDTAASLHPSAWHEALAPQRKGYEKISKSALVVLAVDRSWSSPDPDFPLPVAHQEEKE